VRALVRVRLPDHLVLQATFGAHEPVSHIHAFVQESLREQGYARRSACTSRRGSRGKHAAPPRSALPACARHRARAIGLTLIAHTPTPRPGLGSLAARLPLPCSFEFHLSRPAGTVERGQSLRLERLSETITEANLAPASLLNLHVAEGAVTSGAPFLNAELMASATRLE
jgi:hypothetical protein